ncbi:MAG TPA: hypothetical protein VIL46_14525, partial [Gemmataceae bacterium]
MSHLAATRLGRRAFLKGGPMALAAALDLVPASSPAAGAPPDAKLDPRPDVREKLAALGPNRAALLGKAAVLGEFNDTACRYDLHKTGPRGRDYSIK